MAAHIRTTNTEFYVCSECPDGEATRHSLERQERSREQAAAFHGYFNIQLKKVIMTICDPCVEKIEDKSISS